MTKNIFHNANPKTIQKQQYLFRYHQGILLRASIYRIIHVFFAHVRNGLGLIPETHKVEKKKTEPEDNNENVKNIKTIVNTLKDNLPRFSSFVFLPGRKKHFGRRSWGPALVSTSGSV